MLRGENATMETRHPQSITLPAELPLTGFGVARREDLGLTGLQVEFQPSGKSPWSTRGPRRRPHKTKHRTCSRDGRHGGWTVCAPKYEDLPATVPFQPARPQPISDDAEVFVIGGIPYQFEEEVFLEPVQLPRRGTKKLVKRVKRRLVNLISGRVHPPLNDAEVARLSQAGGHGAAVR